MQGIAQQGQRPIQRIGGHVVQLNIFNAVLLEASLLELPIQMVPAVFKNVEQSDVFVGILKIVEDLPSKRHIHNVAEAVKIWSGANQNAAGPKNRREPLQYYIAGYRQVLDHLRKEYTVELGVSRIHGLA